MGVSPYPIPPYRSLRVYTFDPSARVRLETVLINETVLQILWEDDLQPGPSGEYIEVVDYDPASDCFYEPVDLNDRRVLATHGLTPSEGNPQFHQQMVYAVAMATIFNFEKALGRKALWGCPGWDPEKKAFRREPVLTLRIYPHALREANAYYSPAKKALLFGYFPAALSDGDEAPENLPGGLVFTCLSHDVVAHETTHALLDGLHRYYSEDTSPDSLAFHEAFADIVALFQHFSVPEALRHQIAKTSGDLRTDNLLAELAHQFGQAIGNHGALRNAIATKNEDGEWVHRKPSPRDYVSATEPHDRGSVLVAAVFDAFLAVYESRTRDLLRIATGGTGRLPEGTIHPDLVNRLAGEASSVAAGIVQIAIRALDYCPPVDLTFGDYLRAVVTADAEIRPDDDLGYRIAVIEAFRQRGIYPHDVRTLADDALRWRNPLRAVNQDNFSSLLAAFAAVDDGQGKDSDKEDAWRVSNDRARIAATTDGLQYETWRWLKQRFSDQGRPNPHEESVGFQVERTPLAAMGLALRSDAPRSIYRSSSDGKPSLQVHSTRYALRHRQDGVTIRDVVVEIVQKRRGYFDPKIQREVDGLANDLPTDPSQTKPKYRPDFHMRGGCTLLIDGETGLVRYVITKDILSEGRLGRQRKYLSGDAASDMGMAYIPARNGPTLEPFAMLHRGY
jgi:hypothetical protein